MAEDAEAQLYRDIADLTEQVPALQNKINSVDSHYKQLSTKVKRIEIQGLQEQITSLGESLLETSRVLARLEMDFTQNHICTVIVANISSPKREQLTEQIRLTFARSATSLGNSPKPLSIAKQFKDTCMKYSTDYNLNAWF